MNVFCPEWGRDPVPVPLFIKMGDLRRVDTLNKAQVGKET